MSWAWIGYWTAGRFLKLLNDKVWRDMGCFYDNIVAHGRWKTVTSKMRRKILAKRFIENEANLIGCGEQLLEREYGNHDVI